MQLIGHEYIRQTRAYCDYLEEHFNNIAKAFEEVTEACRDLIVENCDYYTLLEQVEQHDLSKFSAEEFTQYISKFFPITSQQSPYLSITTNVPFDQAWKHHYLNNTHHWESARTQTDILHMVIDWTAMSYKFGGTAQSYYEANQHKIKLNPNLTEFMYTIFNYLKDSHEHINQHGTSS